jgi:acyl-CoA reductase-like NAD-dependent aldehyde dehydrogenase
MTVYAQPRQEAAKVTFKARYENWIGGGWVPPSKGQYFKNITPITGRTFTEAARGTAEDIELALDAAHKAAPGWGKTPPADRALVLNRIADRIMDNLELLAVAETWDNGKPIREILAADHFRYVAWRHPRPGRLAVPDRRRHHGPPLPRTPPVSGPPNGNIAYRAGRDIQAGRLWVNNYHAYRAHAGFGGDKSSGIGPENHLMMLDHYQQTKNLLVSHSESRLGFF